MLCNRQTHNAQELMRGLAREPAGCSNPGCGAACPDGTTAVAQAACGADGTSRTMRCCPSDSYPEVFLWVDRGVSQCLVDVSRLRALGLDPSLLTSTWSNVRELLLLPGGAQSSCEDSGRQRTATRRPGCTSTNKPLSCAAALDPKLTPPLTRARCRPLPPKGGTWQQRTAYQELDLANPETLATFLRTGLSVFPPSANRKHALVFWNHGSGWAGYGIDSTCSPLKAYTDRGCDMLTMATITQGAWSRAALTSTAGGGPACRWIGMQVTAHTLQSPEINKPCWTVACLAAAGLTAGLEYPPGSGTPYKLDIIGFDACLMAMYEVALALAPHSRYLLASEILEPGHGWDYSALGAITAGPAAGLSAADVGAALIQSYLQYGASAGTVGLALALVDLAAFGQLQTDLSALARSLQTQLSGPGGNGEGPACTSVNTKCGRVTQLRKAGVVLLPLQLAKPLSARSFAGLRASPRTRPVLHPPAHCPLPQPRAWRCCSNAPSSAPSPAPRRTLTSAPCSPALPPRSRAPRTRGCWCRLARRRLRTRRRSATSSAITTCQT